jgi:hypothetical protein
MVSEHPTQICSDDPSGGGTTDRIYNEWKLKVKRRRRRRRRRRREERMKHPNI